MFAFMCISPMVKSEKNITKNKTKQQEFKQKMAYKHAMNTTNSMIKD